MPSFDVVNNVDMQELSNAVNNANKELTQRWDFKGSNSEIELSAKTNQIVLRTEDEMKMRALGDILITHAVQRKLDTDCLEFKAVEMAGGKMLRREIEIHQGIDRDIARQIVKDVKDAKAKVQVAIQGEELRVSGKKRDDLQGVIALLKSGEYKIPLQFINMRD